jgi:hypothetical protein
MPFRGRSALDLRQRRFRRARDHLAARLLLDAFLERGNDGDLELFAFGRFRK